MQPHGLGIYAMPWSLLYEREAALQSCLQKMSKLLPPNAIVFDSYTSDDQAVIFVCQGAFEGICTEAQCFGAEAVAIPQLMFIV